MAAIGTNQVDLTAATILGGGTQPNGRYIHVPNGLSAGSAHDNPSDFPNAAPQGAPNSANKAVAVTIQGGVSNVGLRFSNPA